MRMAAILAISSANDNHDNVTNAGLLAEFLEVLIGPEAAELAGDGALWLSGLATTLGFTGENAVRQTILKEIFGHKSELNNLLDFVGIEALIPYIGSDAGRFFLRQFPLAEVVACGKVTFDQVIFTVEGYRLDEHECLIECLTLPWSLSEYSEVFSGKDECPDDTDMADMIAGYLKSM
jgi:hypothetical protein